MKRIVMTVLLVAGVFGIVFAQSTNLLDNLESELETMFSDISAAISESMSHSMSFYSGVGNTYPPDTLEFLGFKMGVGAGVVFSPLASQILAASVNKDALGKEIEQRFQTSANPTNQSAFANIATAFSLLPLPYDTVYAKIGLPEFTFLPQIDVGVRVGVLPNVGGLLGNTNFQTKGFHIGVEGRARMIERFVFHLDVNASLDLDTGSFSGAYVQITNLYAPDTNGNYVETATQTFEYGLSFGWTGVTLGAKVIAGASIPFILTVYAGLGLHFNIGANTTQMYAKGSIEFNSPYEVYNGYMEASGESSKGFDFAELRAFAGIQLFFVNIATEYSISTGALAFTIQPITLRF